VNYKEFSICELYDTIGILPTFNPSGDFTKSFQKKIIKKNIDPDSIQLKSKKVIIEAGHIYTDHIPTKEHSIGANIASKLGKMLLWSGYAVENWLFIDNMPNHNPENKIFDLVGYLKILNENGFSPDKILYEKDFIGKAHRGILDGISVKNIDGILYLPYGNTKLTEKSFFNQGNPKFFIENEKFPHIPSSYPSCALLDSALYEQKMYKSDFNINILPNYYKDEQKAVKNIFKYIGDEKYKKSTSIIYFNQDAKFEFDGYHNSELLYPAMKHHLKDLTPESLNHFLQYCKNHICGDPKLELEVLGYVC
jgi:hypothetical protein